MPSWDPGLPPWADSLLILTVIASPIIMWLLNRSTSRSLTAVKGQVAAVEEQTVNNHADADYPNLRDELTAMRLTAEATSEAVGRLTDTVAATQRDIGGMREEQRAERRERRDVSTRLDDHLREAPNLIATAIALAEGEHIAACPLRNPKES